MYSIPTKKGYDTTYFDNKILGVYYHMCIYLLVEDKYKKLDCDRVANITSTRIY